MKKKVGVCLSGCGFRDGAEIHEAAHILLALDQAGAEAVIMAPDTPQAGVINHLTGKEELGVERNVLIESARIARGEIIDVAEARAEELDALIFPGGFGAAATLCSFLTEGIDCAVNHDVERLVNAMHQAGKPIGAACIAPALVARILGRRGIAARLTIGDDAQVAAAIDKMGCRHENCSEGEAVIDREHRVASTPAFMYGDSGLARIYAGIRKMVDAVLEMAG